MGSELIYRCHFEPVDDYQWILLVDSGQTGQPLKVQVKIFDDDLTIRTSNTAPPLALDLIEIAMFIHAVDRSIQPDSHSHCNVHVVIPTRSFGHISHKDAIEQLISILYWYTGYEWTFEFLSRDVPLRSSEHAQLFNWRNSQHPTEVALWSGGLDCLAGLYNRANQDGNINFVLCGTGSNNRIHGLQKDVISLLPGELAQRVRLSQIRYGLETLNGNLPRSPRLRSRGFTFVVIGAVCAYLQGAKSLKVYENGIGALNLRFRESEIGLNHARSVHPLSLMMIGQWVSSVLNQTLRIQNPFLYWTKAEMCRIFHHKDDLHIAFRTQTCDRMHRKSGNQQCGRCSSCILRRYAFAILGVQDQTGYVYEDEAWLHGMINFDTIEEGNHVPAAIYQVQNLYNHLQAEDPWLSLTRHYETLNANVVDRTCAYEGLSASEMQANLLGLFERYVAEWQQLGHVFNRTENGIQ